MFDEFKENFKESASRFFVLENLVLAGMLCALGIVITTVTGMLPILPRYMKLGLGSVAKRCIGYLLGPAVSIGTAFVMDIVGYMMNPSSGTFFIGFTINEMLAGFIYGVAFYNKKLTIKRVLVANIIVMVLCNLFINTALMEYMGYGKFTVLISSRFIKNMIMLPVNTLVFFMLEPAMTYIKIRMRSVKKLEVINKAKNTES